MFVRRNWSFVSRVLIAWVVLSVAAIAATYNTGKGPQALVTADFNGDGKLDVAVVNRIDGTVSIFLNQGNGEFASPVVYSVGRGPVSVAAGELRNSGRTDLVIADHDSNELVVLFGKGDGAFEAPQHLLSVDKPGAVAVADLSHSGQPWIAVSSEAGEIRVYGYSDGKLEEKGSYSAAGKLGVLTAADLRGNGLLDLVVSDIANGRVFILSNRGDGTFSEPQQVSIGGTPTGVTTLSAIERGDCVVIGRNLQPATSISPAADALVARPAIASVSSATQLPLVAVADQNGNTISILGRNKAGQLGVLSTVTRPTPSAATLADLDGSGNAVLLATSYSEGTLTADTPTTTSLTSNINPSTYGQSVTYTATVSSMGSGTPNTGLVSFYDGSTYLGARSLSSGQAVISISTLSVATHNLTASYGGDSIYGGSTSSIYPQVVNGAPTTVALTSNTNPASYGQAINITATVSSGAGTPNSGLVSFYDGGKYLGARGVSSGKAVLSISTLADGTHNLTASYGGNSVYAVSPVSAAYQQVVNGIATTTTLKSSVNPAAYGQSISLTATVSTTSSGAPSTGSVSFYDGTTYLGARGVSSGTASMSVSTFSAGTHSITAKYTGDAKYGVSTSSVLSQVVDYVSTTTRLTSNTSTTTFGQAITFTATVTSGGGTPHGNVVFNSVNGGVKLYLGTRSLNGSGVATLSYPALPGGTNTVTATYDGADQFAGSVSSGKTQTVHKANVTASVTASSNPVNENTSVTLTATIVATAPAANYETPLGTVSFYDGFTLLSTQTLSKCGCDGTNTVQYTTKFTSSGTHYLSVQYSGDQNYNSATSNYYQLTVNR